MATSGHIWAYVGSMLAQPPRDLTDPANYDFRVGIRVTEPDTANGVAVDLSMHLPGRAGLLLDNTSGTGWTYFRLVEDDLYTYDSNNDAYAQGIYLGEPLNLRPGMVNLLHNILGGPQSAGAINATMTLTRIYVTPRYRIL